MRGQNYQISTIFDPNCNTFSAAVLQRGEKSKSRTIMSIIDYCRTRWYTFGGGRPTNNGDRRASLQVGWEDFATFGKYGVISRKRHKVGIQLLWTTYRKSYAFFRTVILPITWVTPNPNNGVFWYIGVPFCVSGASETTHFINLVHLIIAGNRRHAAPKWDVAKCWQKVAISQKRHNIAAWLQGATNRKSYAAYRMMTSLMTLSDP